MGEPLSIPFLVAHLRAVSNEVECKCQIVCTCCLTGASEKPPDMPEDIYFIC